MLQREVIAILGSSLALCCACASAPLAPAANGPSDAWATLRGEWEAAAAASTQRGDHLGASRYLEASLAAGGDEERLLPLLVASQIRAGRLRAARESIACLEALHPRRPGLAELGSLLDAMIDLPSAGAPDRRRAAGAR